MKRRNQIGIAALGCWGTAGLGLVLAGGLLTAVIVFVRQQAGDWIDTAIANQLDAEVTYGEVDISLLSSFPNVEVTIGDLRIRGKGPFSEVDLAVVDEVGVALDLTSLFREATTIRSLSLKHPVLDWRIDADGNDNLDIFGEDDGTESQTALVLDDIQITDLQLRWRDQTSDLTLDIEDLDLAATGAVANDISQLKTRTQLSGLSLRMGSTRWLNGATASAEGGISYDTNTGGMTFRDLAMSLNALPLILSGTAIPSGEAYDLDLTFAAPDSEFKALLSLVPEVYGSSFEDVETTGRFTLNGKTKGRYLDDAYPAFDLDLTVEDGKFAYPDLPSEVTDITADLSVRHPQGPLDKTEIDLKAFSLATSGSPFRGSGTIRTPLSDPQVETTLKGRLDLAALGAALPQDGPAPTGQVDMDLAIAGRMSDFESQQIDRVQATGVLRGRGLTLRDDAFPVPLNVEALDMTFSPAQIEIQTLALAYGDSDLALTGHIDNLLPYLLADADLTGDLSLVSKTLDLRPFQGDETEDPSEAEKDEDLLVAIPDTLKLSIDAEIGTLKTERFDLSDLTSAVEVADASLLIASLKASMAGGDVAMSGRYSAPTAESADVDLRIDALKFDLIRTLTTFTTLAKLVPFLDGAKGRFNSDFTLKTRLDAQGNPDLSLVSSSGTLIPLDINLQEGVLVSTLRSFGGMKSLQLDNALVRYDFQDGRIALRPVTTTLNQMPATLQGTAGVLDQTLDLTSTVRVPTQALAGHALLATAKKGLGEAVDVQLNITGTWTKPKVKLALAGGLTDRAADVVDEVLAEARKEADRLLEEADQAGEVLRQKAVEAGDLLRKEAASAGRRLKKEAAGNPIKVALATEAAKKLDTEADKAAKKLVREANKAADKLLAEAEAQADNLLDRASKTSDDALRRP